MKKTICAVFSVVLTGCASGPEPMPQWISDPGQGSVGQAGFHVKGRAHQLMLATARARDELAARQGVELSSVQLLSERISNDNVSTKMQRKSQQAVTKVSVKARVVENWCDAASGECWVWMMPE